MPENNYWTNQEGAGRRKTFPTLHLNGTHPKDLYEETEKTYNLLQAALDQLCKSGPNARDYYPQSNEAYGAARDEHDARVQALRTLMTHCEDLMGYIADDPYAQRRMH